MARFRKVARVADVPEGQGIVVEAGGKRAVLFNVCGGICAVEAPCVQHHAPSEKRVICGARPSCPWHGMPVDLARGICLAFAATAPAGKYAAKVKGADILAAI
ncbi:MAG: Rieske 2Fe-2S domain-containing protein [Candidatus Rokubacteria bacterium]|nr:Rieske 2Fe-2S domain-containing protein [Candidatus Rokubacteria bacterium]